MFDWQTLMHEYATQLQTKMRCKRVSSIGLKVTNVFAAIKPVWWRLIISDFDNLKNRDCRY